MTDGIHPDDLPDGARLGKAGNVYTPAGSRLPAELVDYPHHIGLTKGCAICGTEIPTSKVSYDGACLICNKEHDLLPEPGSG